MLAALAPLKGTAETETTMFPTAYTTERLRMVLQDGKHQTMYTIHYTCMHHYTHTYMYIHACTYTMYLYASLVIQLRIHAFFNVIEKSAHAYTCTMYMYMWGAGCALAWLHSRK